MITTLNSVVLSSSWDGHVHLEASVTSSRCSVLSCPILVTKTGSPLTWQRYKASKWNRIAQLVKNPPAMQETCFDSWVGKIPWRREWLPTPVFYTVHGVNKESDRTEWLSLSFTSSLWLHARESGSPFSSRDFWQIWRKFSDQQRKPAILAV